MSKGVSSITMRESFFEKYGSWFALGLVTLFTWRLVSTGLHESEAFKIFFPLHWIDALPFAPVIQWMWAEIAITVIAWLLMYFVGRTVFRIVISMEGLSMWVAFILCIVLAVAFILMMLKPAFDQMTIWRSAWPKP